MYCKICSETARKIFKTKILSKYPASFYQCPRCKFIQTDTPHWLSEAYSSAIADLDVGLVSRNIHYAEKISQFINCFFNPNDRFLDYAGGYGLFVRLMRDKGFDFYRQDKYCENIFSKNFDLQDFDKIKLKFSLVTAFEFFEHCENPLQEIDILFDLSDILFFSTELQPKKVFTNSSDWWYFSEETGQHIAFYSKDTFTYIAQEKNLFFYTNGKDNHILSKNPFRKNPFKYIMEQHLPIDTLLQKDYAFTKKLLQKESKNFLKKEKNRATPPLQSIYEIQKDKSDRRNWKVKNILQQMIVSIFPNESNQRIVAILFYKRIKSLIIKIKWVLIIRQRIHKKIPKNKDFSKKF